MQWNNYCEILVRYKCIHVIKPKTSETSLILQLQHVKVIPPTVLFQISFTKLGSSITCWDIFALQLPLWSRRHASRDKNLGARVSNLAAFCLTVKTTNICIHTHIVNGYTWIHIHTCTYLYMNIHMMYYVCPFHEDLWISMCIYIYKYIHIYSRGFMHKKFHTHMIFETSSFIHEN